MEPGELGIALAHKLIAALSFPFSKFNARMGADHEDPIDSDLTPNIQQPMEQDLPASPRVVTFKDKKEVRVFEVDEQDQKERRLHNRDISYKINPTTTKYPKSWVSKNKAKKAGKKKKKRKQF